MYQSRNNFGAKNRSSHRGFRRPSNFNGRSGGFNKPVNSNIAHTYILRATKNNAAITQVEEVVSTMPVENMHLSHSLLSNMQSHGYTHFTPIQEKVIPLVLADRDVIGLANTGTGKTASFLVPIIQKHSQDRSFRAVIVAPTRELATQIRDELRVLSRNMGIYSALLIGQASMGLQMQDLRRRPTVVIGTPGRIKDHIARRSLDLKSFQVFVLDEVDQMLDMGFVHDIRSIVSSLPPKRQSLFFSATLEKNIELLANSFLQNPERVSVKTSETTSHIKQEIVKIEQSKTKTEVLKQLLTNPELTKVLIFGRTKHGVEKLGQELEKCGIRVTTIHGNKSQPKRSLAIKQFKENAIRVLIATDVAARGIDIKDISHVINYDVPDNYENYIHRIGRTGRAGSRGVALTFVDGK